MHDCNKLIDNNMYLRYVVTILSLYLISININNKIIKKYIYLILFLLLILLDYVDNIFKCFYKNTDNCTKTFHYQLQDKICDSVSYLFLCLFFKFDGLLLFFILYRLIGILLFYFTKNSKWFILYFDFAKEYLLYLFIFGKNYTFLPLFILCKIYFEYYYHTIHNPSSYK
jgi:hypothetical protein